MKHWYAAHGQEALSAVVLTSTLFIGMAVGRWQQPPRIEVVHEQTGAWSLCHEDEAYLIMPTYHGEHATPKFTYDWQCEPVDNLYAAGFNAAVEKFYRGDIKPVITTEGKR